MVGHSEDPVRNHAANDEMQINQFQYQMTGGAAGSNAFRGTGDDWNALSNGAAVKQSVDSSAQMVSTAGNQRNPAQMHQTFRKGRYRQIANNTNQ